MLRSYKTLARKEEHRLVLKDVIYNVIIKGVHVHKGYPAFAAIVSTLNGFTRRPRG